MVSWYYVVGSERVGPVTEEALKNLFLKNDINLETYVWKKGFPNWERLKDVGELKFEQKKPEASERPKAHPIIPPTAKPAPAGAVAKTTASSPAEKESAKELTLSFDWKKVDESQEIFFVRIGSDRKNFNGTDIYGPYSLTELKAAIAARRINHQSELYSPGMKGWVTISETPLNESFTGKAGSNDHAEAPLILVFNQAGKPLFAMIKAPGIQESTLLGQRPFSKLENQLLNASLYAGNEIKAKNIQVKIKGYDKLEQSVTCQFVELNQDAKKIMLNHVV